MGIMVYTYNHTYNLSTWEVEVEFTVIPQLQSRVGVRAKATGLKACL